MIKLLENDKACELNKDNKGSIKEEDIINLITDWTFKSKIQLKMQLLMPKNNEKEV